MPARCGLGVAEYRVVATAVSAVSIIWGPRTTGAPNVRQKFYGRFARWNPTAPPPVVRRRRTWPPSHRQRQTSRYFSVLRNALNRTVDTEQTVVIRAASPGLAQFLLLAFARRPRLRATDAIAHGRGGRNSDVKGKIDEILYITSNTEPPFRTFMLGPQERKCHPPSIESEIPALYVKWLRLGVTYEKGVTLGNVTMSHRTRERPAECLASLSHSTMIGLPRAQH
ncbi:hypothetical protein EVAR_10167_1 [Eumeta japonica]|uniref:Uncharacterized protein n=1 Tax=Eumeta variegata TaxID=151549 RepID=A0A4C1TGC2_EUMVA|nr:hypothetical protein EVAR_10167_1 [Eumeta japonica]